MEENVKKVKKVKTEEESLKKRPSEAHNIETNHSENEESLDLPDVPMEELVPANSIDQEIEDRLLKLKFFNRVWLSSKEPTKPPEERSLALKDIAFLDTNDPENVLKADQIEPIESSNKEREDFNTWYEKKLDARNLSKVKNYPNPIFTTPMPTVDSAPSSDSLAQCTVEVDRSRPHSDRQSMFNTCMVWQPSMNMFIVMIIAMFKLLMLNWSKIPRHAIAHTSPDLTPVPRPHSPSYLSRSSPCSVNTSVKQQVQGTTKHSDSVDGWNISFGFWKYHLKIYKVN